MATKWGIVGAGHISGDFVTAMKVLNEQEHRIMAVAARSHDAAQTFAKQHNIEKSYGSYKELSMNPNVEVVYIGTIHPYHFDTASMMLLAGKHCLVEKPLCMNVKQTKKLIQLAREKKLFLMEAVWSRFMPVYKELNKRIQSGEIGDIVQVFSTFGQSIAHIPRAIKKDLGGGSMLDIGIYTIQFVTLAMGGERPTKIVATGHLNDDGVDESVSASMAFSNGRLATINTSIKCILPNEGIVVGTKGTIKVADPMWCPETLVSPSGEFVSRFPNTGAKFNFTNSQGLMYEAEETRRCLMQGLIESPVFTLEDSLIIAEIMEEIRKQVGVVYTQDA